MTYERVLEVFKDYLSADKDSELLNTSRGYLVLYWESCHNTWVTARLVQEPEELRDILRERYEEFQSYQFSQARKRDPDPVEREEIARMGAELAAKCGGDI